MNKKKQRTVELKEIIRQLENSRKILAEEKEKYRTLIENAAEAIIVVQDGMIKFANPKGEELYGYSQEELASRHHIDFIHEKDREMVEERHKKRLKGKELPSSYPFRIVNRTGDTKWVELNVSVFSWDGRSATLCFMTDITERKRMEETLHESEELYRQLVENVNDIIYITDENGLFTFFNNTALRILRYSEEEVIGKPYLDLVCPEYQKRVERFYGLQFAKKTLNKYYEFPILTKQGNKIWLGQNTQLIIETNQVVGIQAIARDITEHKKAEEVLKEREELLNSITTSALDAIVVLDYDGNVVFWNNSAEKIFGYKPEEITGKDFHNIIVPAKYHEAHKNGFSKFKKTGKGNAIGATLELEALHKNGKKFPIELSLSAIRINKQWHSTGIIRDITQRKKTEATLKNTIKTKDKFFTIIAHDLKAPFNTLLGFSELLLKEYDSKDAEENKEMITHIFNSATHGFDLLNNLLEWSRSQTGRIEYEPQDFSLTDLVRQNILSISDAAYKKNIEVQNEMEEQILAYADRRMINTIVRNLISNAIKFTKSGGEISVSAIKGDGVLIISVIDSGVGIKEENISKLFRLEESINTPGTDNERGTGLGLILCKEFVEKNGGKIWVESKCGEGSKFNFTIPVP